MPLLERLCADLSSVIAEDSLGQFRVLQVKEKMGSLRFHARGGNERPWTMIEAAGHASQRTCEGCGTPSVLRSQGGWYTPLCDICVDGKSRRLEDERFGSYRHRFDESLAVLVARG